jgi:GntR family transcriptional regulator
MPGLDGDWVPKYVRIANSIRDQIIRGDIRPGENIMSIRQIMASWGVSLPTATKVVSALRADGLVETRPGVGTVVIPAPTVIRGGHERHLVIAQSTRISRSATRSEVTTAQLEQPPEDVRAALDLPPSSLALCRRRIKYNGVPRSTSLTWARPELAELEPRLLEPADLPDEVATYVAAATNRTPQFYRERVLARLASSDEARDLKLAQPAAVLVAYHTIYDTEGGVLTYEVSIYPPNRVRYEDEIQLGGVGLEDTP